MRTTSIFMSFALSLLLWSCSDDIVGEGTRSKAAKRQNVTFTFDAIEAPSNWAQYQTLEEMLDACQIPEEKLKSMSTDELIEVCMSHPLHALYFYYNNELDGADVVFSHFNGFVELNKRADAADKMLAFYDDINFNSQANLAHRKDFTSATYSGFVDLFMASKQLGALYDSEHLQKLEQISARVLEKKLAQSPDDIYTIRRSLLISSQVKLVAGGLTAKEARVLNSFVKSGGNVDAPQTYSEVSAIVAK